MAERAPSRAGSETRTDLPVSEVPEEHPGLAATALDAEASPPARRRSEGIGETTGEQGEEAPDPWIGRMLANVYRVDAKIGQGGMGAVYRATHVHLGKQVAVKVLTEAIAQKRDAVERLRQEAIAASSIDHDNIVDVVSFDRYDDGSVFIVMELLRGESLSDRLDGLRERGERMPLEQTLQIALQICDALGAAHERGIVHRDLKPENVFLAKKGDRERVKVLDFGISKVKTAESEQVRMTRTGQLVGTPLYMSPEQARGEVDVDRRVDVYALGVMLFEMLAGAPPFDGRNYFELLWKHGNEPPPSVRERAPDAGCPPELDAVVRKALAKTREERFQTMDELATALRAAAPWVGAPGPSIPPEQRLSRPSSPLEEAVGSRTSSPSPFVPERPSMPGPIPFSSTAPASKTFVAAAAVLLIASTAVVGWLTTSSPRTAASPGASQGGAEAPGNGAPAAPPAAPLPSAPSAETRTRTEAPSERTSTAPAEASSMVTVSLGSLPAGADVFEGRTRLCTTPCLHDFAAGTEHELVFRREGYIDAVERVVPVDGGAVVPRLRPRRRASSGHEGGAGSGPAIKTTL